MTLTLIDLEIVATALLCLVCAFAPVAWLRWRGARRWLAQLAGGKRRAIWLAGLAGVLVSMGLSLVVPVEPRFHDEFSYLLGADTFASGRLANPTHPLWPHFETYHVIWEPSYQSKYPPGQALLLALGQRLFFAPIVGVWMGMGLASAALCWMLQAFVPVRWALAGALLPLLRFGIFSNNAHFAYWSRSYWGGALALMGGAQVFGALRRIVDDARLRDALWLGVGGGVLLLTRPFEGALVAIAVAGVGACWLLRQRGAALRRALLRVVLPGGLVLAIFVAGVGAYHAQVTGDPLTAPYQVYESRYSGGVSGFFSASAAAEASPRADNEAMRSHYEVLRDARQWHMDSASELLAHTRERLGMLAEFGLGPLLLLPLVLNGLALLRERWMLFALGTLALVLSEVAVLDYAFPHYVAPVAPLAVLLALQSLRSWQGFRLRGRRFGAYAARGTLVLCVASFALATGSFVYRSATTAPHWHLRRAQIAERLESQPGRHLVLVQYAPEPVNPEAEWVYNAADIDASKVVWARSLGRDRNRALFEHFADRRLWLLLADERPAPLRPMRRPGRDAGGDELSGEARSPR